MPPASCGAGAAGAADAGSSVGAGAGSAAGSGSGGHEFWCGAWGGIGAVIGRCLIFPIQGAIGQILLSCERCAWFMPDPSPDPPPDCASRRATNSSFFRLMTRQRQGLLIPQPTELWFFYCFVSFRLSPVVFRFLTASFGFINRR